MIDGTFDGCIEGMRKFLLIDVMLVLTDPDGFGVDLDKLGEGVLYAAGDRYSAADDDIVFGQFLLGQRRSRVYGGTGFVGDDVVDIVECVFADEFRGELLGFIGGCTIADGNQCDVMLADGGEHGLGCGGLGAVALRNLQDTVVEYLSCRIDNSHLAAVAVAGVEAHDRVTGERCLQQELAQVRTEYFDGLGFGSFCELAADFAFEGGQQQALIAVSDGSLQAFLPDGWLAADAVIDAAAVFFMIGFEFDFECAFRGTQRTFRVPACPLLPHHRQGWS